MKRALIYIIVLMLSGCIPTHMRQMLQTAPTDWVMSGGSPERTNATHSVILPPLTVAWEYDALAGFSGFSAITSDSFLFVSNLQGEVHMINISNGKVAGTYDFGSAIAGSPVIDNNRMYVPLSRDEQSFVCYSMPKGTVEWSANIGEVETSPLIIGSRIFITTLQGKLVCLDKSTGTEIWAYLIPSPKDEVMIHSSPAGDENVVVFGADNGNVYAVNTQDGTLRWKAVTRKSIFSSPSISSGKVFISSLDSTLYALDLSSGVVVWKRPLGSRIYSSQAIGNNRLYTTTTGGSVLALDVLTGNIVWNVPMNSVINATPLLSGNVLYVGGLDKTLTALNAESGAALWQYKAEGRIKTAPIIFSNHLFLLTEDHSVIAFIQSAQ